MAGYFTEHHPEPKSEGGGKKSSILESKIGGIPTWLLVLAGVVLVWYYESRKTAAVTATATTTTTQTPAEYAASYAAAHPTSPTAYLGAGEASGAGYPTGTTTGTKSPAGAPTLSSINPTSGPATGGGTAVISGTNLVGTTGVSFGGTPAAFSVSNTQTIYVTIPADQTASGGNTAQVTVVTPIGSVTGLGFAYTGKTPTTVATPKATTPKLTTPKKTTPPVGATETTPKWSTMIPMGSGYAYAPGGHLSGGSIMGRTGASFSVLASYAESLSLVQGGTTIYYCTSPGNFAPISSASALNAIEPTGASGGKTDTQTFQKG